jgi:ChrB-like protein
MKSAMSMSSGNTWVLLAYRLPREPSTPRIALWRRLRQLGALQLVDGLVALPLDEQTREHLEWLAQDVTDAGGEASVWISEPASAAQQRQLVERMKESLAADYRIVIDAAKAAHKSDEAKQRRAVARLRRTLQRIDSRDYVRTPERRAAERAVKELASLVEARK